ncbi:hypothetical protein TELCIR_09956 [Teladorsagia circumcincta]|uniref:Uncharacterized protein n=1 Tax=Teladorsagia circumcincta TaxID=45464 RepID=A0A2G9UDH1_TELCI|nr:hypothetical protein TELCIR_09956 [Teladorsagia circumcincta]
MGQPKLALGFAKAESEFAFSTGELFDGGTPGSAKGWTPTMRRNNLWVQKGQSLIAKKREKAEAQREAALAAGLPALPLKKKRKSKNALPTLNFGVVKAAPKLPAEEREARALTLVVTVVSSLKVVQQHVQTPKLHQLSSKFQDIANPLNDCTVNNTPSLPLSSTEDEFLSGLCLESECSLSTERLGKKEKNLDRWCPVMV